jgi:hypothetical protein
MLLIIITHSNIKWLHKSRKLHEEFVITYNPNRFSNSSKSFALDGGCHADACEGNQNASNT